MSSNISRSKSPKINYVEEIIEWQEKQYLPGEYLGGKLPPHLRWPTRRLGFVFLSCSIIGFVFVATEIPTLITSSWVDNLGSITVITMTVLTFLAAIKILRKKQ